MDSEEQRVVGTLVDAIGYFKASNISGGFGFAVSLSADGETLAVGATAEQSASTGINGLQGDSSAISAGAVYVFTRSNTGWQQQAYVKASNTDAWDSFGYAVSLSANGDTLAVAATFEASAAIGVDGDQDDNSLANAGAVYVFARNADNWQQQAYIKANDATEHGSFGSHISLAGDGDRLAVGSSGSKQHSRSAFV